MIFSLRQIQEKTIEQYQELYTVFVDFWKAFDTVDRDMLWKVLQIFGCPHDFIEIIKQLHVRTTERVTVSPSESEPLEVNHGTKQVCVLAPTLFTLFLTTVLVILHQEMNEGVNIRRRTDGKLFNLARQRARTKTREDLVTDFLFADDTALISHGEATMQRMVDIFSETTNKIGLYINITNTEIMGEAHSGARQLGTVPFGRQTTGNRSVWAPFRVMKKKK